MTREHELIRQGWQKQATYDEPRLSEMVEMYAEIGWEVHLEPLHPEDEKVCTRCMQLIPANYKTIYTRRKIKEEKNHA